MAKDKCRVSGCRYQLWNGGFCRIHQFFIQNKKGKTVDVMEPKPTYVLPTNMSIAKLLTIADDELSTYKRREHGDIIKCVTCNATATWKSMDCGHYMKRDHDATRYLETNTGPQCHTCNRYNDGEDPKFREFLVKKYGEKKVVEVEKMARTVKHWTRTELLDIIKFYREINKKFDQ